MGKSLFHLPFTIYYSPLFNDPYQVRDGGDDAAHGGRVGALQDLVELGEPDAAHDLLLVLREPDGAAVVLEANLAAALVLLLLFRHFSNLNRCWVLGAGIL